MNRRAFEKQTLLIAFLVLPWFLAACQANPVPAATLPPEPTATEELPTETPTPTIVWFPPTATYTPVPTKGVTPTVDLRSDIGRLVFRDDFSEEGPWSLGRSEAGSAALGKEKLTLHVSEPEGYVFSLRQEPLLKDFYLQITASPTICWPGDEYGLLLRVSPALDFYRFGLTCSGEFRLEKSVDGVLTFPQPPRVSGAVPPGAPSQSRLEVWVKGGEMRFFANGQQLLTLEEDAQTGKILPAGSLGLYARAAGENVITVSFSDLEVRETR